jgi:hypothetical protein
MLFVVSVAAFTFAACGRQVTPDRSTTPSGLPAGFMQVKFTTAQAMDFTNVQYVIMFNTSTSGGMPYANGYQTNYANYWFAIVVGGNGVLSSVQVVQYVRNTGVGGGQVASPQVLPYTPQQLQFNLNSNGQNTQFTVTFDRRLFNGIVPTPSPAPGANPNLWYANWFTTNGSGQPIDAPGIGGPQDQTFTFPTSGLPGFDVSTSFDQQFNANAGWPQVTPRSAQIAGGEIINSP